MRGVGFFSYFSDFYCFRLLATRCVRTHFLQKYATFPEVQIYFQSHRFFHRSQLSSGGFVSRLRPVTKSQQNVTGRNKIPSTWRKILAKRYRSQQNTFDLAQNRHKTLLVATRYLRPGAKSRQNVTGRSKIPPTWREIPPKRYRSQHNTFDLSQNPRKTLQVAAEEKSR